MIEIAEIEGYAAIYERPDLSGDIIRRGAFPGVIAGSVKMLYQHAAEQPIGIWRRFEDRADGLYAIGELHLVSERQREIHGLLRGGALDGLSIGYRVNRAVKIPGGRIIERASLWETSLVTFPMAPRARITHVGPAIPTDDDSFAARATIFGAAQSIQSSIPVTV